MAKLDWEKLKQKELTNQSNQVVTQDVCQSPLYNGNKVLTESQRLRQYLVNKGVGVKSKNLKKWKKFIEKEKSNE